MVTFRLLKVSTLLAIISTGNAETFWSRAPLARVHILSSMKLANSGAADSLLRPGRGMVGVAFAPIVPVTVTQSHLNCGLVGRRSPIASQFGHAPVFSSNFKRGFCGIPNKIVESASERCSAELKGLALAMSAASSLRELKGIKAIDGSDIPSSTFDGKVTLAVNVVSFPEIP